MAEHKDGLILKYRLKTIHLAELSSGIEGSSLSGRESVQC